MGRVSVRPRVLRHVLVATAVALLGAVATAPAADAVNRYQLVGGCYTLQAESGGFVGQSGDGYDVRRGSSSAAHFRMQATALGSYMLFDADRRMPQIMPDGSIGQTRNPGPAADWAVSGAGNNGFKLRSVKTGDALGIGENGLGRVEVSEIERFRFSPANDCANFPEAEVDATGKPFTGTDSQGRVKGFADDHIHLMALEFMGGYFHCGRPWSPYGVTIAMQECQGDAQLSTLADNVLAGRSIDAPNSGGWPNFKDWPRKDALLREATYWKSIERSWRGGLRLMVNDMVQNQALCNIWPVKRLACDDMSMIRQEYKDTLELQDYIDAQSGGPGKGFFRVVRSPAAARKVIESGRLAVVNGVEVSSVFGCSQYMNSPRCTQADIDRGLDEFKSMGIASFFPVHKFDNALGGNHYDNGVTGLLVGLGQAYETGNWMDPQTCPAGQPDVDNNPLSILPPDVFDVLKLLGAQQGGLPIYPRGPLCNPRGLTELGRYVINEMIRRGFIVETDHMSVKARREALKILEQARYPGVISSHHWGDDGSTERLQALGGLVGTFGSGGPQEWVKARANRRKDLYFGFPFASDINGLAAQPGPTSLATVPEGEEAGPSQVKYPFRSYDGGTVFERQKAGNRTYDFNIDGVAQYGLYPDFIENLRNTYEQGEAMTADMFRGAEAYLQLWERTRAATAANR